MRESMLEKKFCAMAAQAGGKAYKFVSPGNAGVPDRLVVLPGGKVGFVELKQEGEAPRKLQACRMAELERLGCFVTVVDNAASAEEAIRKIQGQPTGRGRASRGMAGRAPHGGGQ